MYSWQSIQQSRDQRLVPHSSGLVSPLVALSFSVSFTFKNSTTAKNESRQTEKRVHFIWLLGREYREDQWEDLLPNANQSEILICCYRRILRVETRGFCDIGIQPNPRKIVQSVMYRKFLDTPLQRHLKAQSAEYFVTKYGGGGALMRT